MKKYFRYVLVFLIILFLIFILRLTYSRYITKFDYPLMGHVDAWNIKVNDQDILNNKDFSQTLNITYTENEYIDPTVIAPTSEAYFTVKIDSTGTEVDFDYKLEVSEDAEDTSISYSFEEEDEPTTNDDKTTYHLKVNLQYLGDGSIYTLNQNTGELEDYKFNSLKFDIPAGVTLETTTLPWGVISQSDNTISIVPRYTAWDVTTNTLSQSLPLTLSSTTTNVSRYTLLELCQNVKSGNLSISSSLVPDFRIIGYQKNDDPYVALPNSVSELTGTVTHGATFTTEVINTYKFYVQWYDQPDNILNNGEDVRISKAPIPITQIPVKISFTQKNND